jgi:hypothetical protein
MNKLLLFAFSKLPILNLLDGHKRLISRIVLLLGALLPVLQVQFPQLPILGELNSYVLLVAGWLGLEVGVAHAKAKDS